ncbi:cytochrome b5-like heme/steroid binding domain-containing protein [Lactarius indigo]|nr:cytochrome b5-like heme/steroid binding domain-containing protein [Lactarius indigo]
MSFSLSHPINTALLLYTLYLIQRTVFPSTSVPRKPPTEFKAGYSWLPRAHAPTGPLYDFDGKDGGRILLAIAGTVFDVTAGRGFYGPEGMYGNFAGRDASRGMAKQSFDIEMLTPIDQPLDKLEDLTPEEIENMKGWIEHFSNKYIICGRLVENDAAI